MIHDENSYCKRCGNCCRSMIWQRKFGFKEAFKLAKKQTTKEGIERVLILHYKEYLHKMGLSIDEIRSIEWDKKDKKIIVQVSTGRCKHLLFTKDNKAICLNYKNRPKECRDFLCKKVREKIMLEKIKEREILTGTLKGRLENNLNSIQDGVVS